ncbi:MAG: hypothetical protein KGL39_30385 [Patescibacteria group bacterium]|nr:hypothetical protein [Patescibacteria group bacterium]
MLYGTDHANKLWRIFDDLRRDVRAGTLPARALDHAEEIHRVAVDLSRANVTSVPVRQRPRLSVIEGGV